MVEAWAKRASCQATKRGATVRVVPGFRKTWDGYGVGEGAFRQSRPVEVSGWEHATVSHGTPPLPRRLWSGSERGVVGSHIVHAGRRIAPPIRAACHRRP